MPTLRVVLDTNVLLSGIAYPSSIPGKILSSWRHGSIEVLLSDFILDELRRVLSRLSHRHGLSDIEINDLIDILSIQAEGITPESGDDQDLRDPMDQPVLGTMLAGLKSSKADYLITGDKDLLALSGRYPILKPSEFWSKHSWI